MTLQVTFVVALADTGHFGRRHGLHVNHPPVYWPQETGKSFGHYLFDRSLKRVMPTLEPGSSNPPESSWARPAASRNWPGARVTPWIVLCRWEYPHAGALLFASCPAVDPHQHPELPVRRDNARLAAPSDAGQAGSRIPCPAGRR